MTPLSTFISPQIGLVALLGLMGSTAIPANCGSGDDTTDVDEDGYSPAMGDCDDSDPNVNPGATEVCGDGIDNDCEGGDASCQTEGVCYQGDLGNYSTCLELVDITDPTPGDYQYPNCASLGSTYRAPSYALDLRIEDPDTPIAPNFLLKEITQAYKGDFGIVQVHAIDSLQRVRDDVGIIAVNSGYRSPAYNASVGGASCSRHMYGDGFDMSAGETSLQGLGDSCYREGAGYVQLYETHVHCDWRDDPLDSDFYRGMDGKSKIELDSFLSAYVLAEEGVFSAPATGWDEGEPLRRWSAFAENGDVLMAATGRSFEPPDSAYSLQVIVGYDTEIYVELR